MAYLQTWDQPLFVMAFGYSLASPHAPLLESGADRWVCFSGVEREIGPLLWDSSLCTCCYCSGRSVTPGTILMGKAKGPFSFLFLFLLRPLGRCSWNMQTSYQRTSQLTAQRRKWWGPGSLLLKLSSELRMGWCSWLVIPSRAVLEIMPQNNKNLIRSYFEPPFGNLSSTELDLCLGFLFFNIHSGSYKG